MSGRGPGREGTGEGRARPARVLLADDHELAREAMCSILARESDLEVVGEASDGSAAVTLARRLGPDLVVMDVRMPGLDGLAATRTVKAARPATRVVLLSTHDDSEYVLEGLRAGADGYLLKGATKQEVLATLRAALRGETIVHPALATAMLRQVASGRGVGDADGHGLTARQIDVLRCLATGLTNAEIARDLQVSLNTVKTHVVHVIAKLGAADRTQAAVRAAQLGLLDDA